jgi:hypothetical protein
MTGLLSYIDANTSSLPVAQKSVLHWLTQQMLLRGASQKMLWEEVAFTLPVEG